jgi:hypothetical protein
MKGNEKTIGAVLLIVISILAGILGYNKDAIKAGFCGEAPAAQVQGQ